MDRLTHPLRGISVLVTRTREQSPAVTSELEGLGARVHSLPAIRIEHFPEPRGLSGALGAIREFDHLVFTSVNGVYSFLRHLGPSDPPPSRMPSALCVGPKTAEAWRRSGGVVNAVPGRHTGRDLARIPGGRLEGRSFLILRPEKVEKDIAGLLRKRGAKTREVALYRTLPQDESRGSLQRLLEKKDLDVVLFASPSAVKGVLSMAGVPDAVRGLLAICIGPTTARAAAEAGFEKVVFPETHTWNGMVEVLLAMAGQIRDRR